MGQTQHLPKREALPVEQTWDLTKIFISDEAWETEFMKLQEALEEATIFQGTLGVNADALYRALHWKETLFMELGKLYVYAHLKLDQDTTNNHYQGMETRIASLYTKAAASVAYFKTELMEIPEKTIRLFVDSDERLQNYQHYFEAFFRGRPYILSEKEELLLAKAGEIFSTPDKVFSILNNADLTFADARNVQGEALGLSHGTYGLYLESYDRVLRESAFRSMYKTYGQFKNTLAATLSAHVKEGNFHAEVRGYHSARQAALFNNNIPEVVYDALIDAIHDRFDLMHRYVALRKKALKLDKIAMYDMYVPMVQAIDLQFTFEEAKKIILAALAVLGKEYCQIVEQAFDERWIDPIENQGKRSGAYSSGTYGTVPYILMNWQNTLDNVFTLAHELGHSVHSYYTRNNQPYIYGNYSIFLAEVASTTNENLLIDYLLKEYDDPNIQSYLINHYLDGFKGTVFRQTQFAEFEKFIYEADFQGKALTAEYLSENYLEINQKYYGEAMHYDNEISLEWSRIPHFYYNFYVYQYATGFSAASALSAKILKEGEAAVNRYIDFLKAGSSDYPIEVLKKAGVDMTTNQATKDALSVFEMRLEQLEKLIG